MKMSQKKTCERCKSRGDDRFCELGYERKEKRIFTIPSFNEPVEPCPKPLNIYELLEAQDDYRKAN